jgi:hypothetical protein
MPITFAGRSALAVVTTPGNGKAVIEGHLVVFTDSLDVTTLPPLSASRIGQAEIVRGDGAHRTSRAGRCDDGLGANLWRSREG